MPRLRPSRLAIAGACLAVMSATLVAAARAETFDSRYTSIAAKHCKKHVDFKIDDTEYAVSRVCAGAAGYKVYVDEEDLRETLTIGKTAKQAMSEPAADDHFGAFNGFEDTIEWRSGKDRKPFAAIVGWYFADNEHLETSGRPKSARLLVVLRLPPGPVCSVAYIDRAANTNANTLARKAADEIARGFKCSEDTVHILGKRGDAINARFPEDFAKPDTTKPDETKPDKP
jgi:hypothetical protein